MSDDAGPLGRYLRLLETLTNDRLATLDDALADDVRFVDPFHDVRGRAAMQRVLAKMFADLDDVRFVVVHQAQRGGVGFAAWTLAGTPRSFGRKALELRGASEIHFDADGRVTVHIDHWDAASQLYERLPLLGPVLRRIRRRLAAS